MGSPATYAVVQFLASHGAATQKVISERLEIPQASVSRICRETAGIVKNDSVVPALYSFDATATLSPMTTEDKPNDTGVIRPDGRILIGNSLFTPVPDRLAERTKNELVMRLAESCEKITKLPLHTISTNGWEEIARFFDEYAITIRARIEKGEL